MTSPLAPPSRLVAHAPRRRQLLLLVGALVLVAAAIASLAAYGPVGVLIGGIGIAVFAPAAIWLAWRLLAPRPTLILDDDGLHDHASATAAGRVPWSRITQVTVQTVGGHRMLSVQVRDPHDLLAGQPAVRRRLLATNLSMLGTPVNVPLSAVDVPEDELLAAVERWRQTSPHEPS